MATTAQRVPARLDAGSEVRRRRPGERAGQCADPVTSHRQNPIAGTEIREANADRVRPPST